MDAEPVDPTKAESPGKELALFEGFGPQTPRDIAQPEGENPMIWSLAPEPGQSSLGKIHTHTNAEHKGPGFAMFADPGTHGGYQCNETAGLSEAELEPGPEAQARFGNVKPGDTIEVHEDGKAQIRRKTPSVAHDPFRSSRIKRSWQSIQSLTRVVLP